MDNTDHVGQIDSVGVAWELAVLDTDTDPEPLSVLVVNGEELVRLLSIEDTLVLRVPPLDAEVVALDDSLDDNDGKGDPDSLTLAEGEPEPEADAEPELETDADMESMLGVAELDGVATAVQEVVPVRVADRLLDAVAADESVRVGSGEPEPVAELVGEREARILPLPVGLPVVLRLTPIDRVPEPLVELVRLPLVLAVPVVVAVLLRDTLVEDVVVREDICVAVDSVVLDPDTVGRTDTLVVKVPEPDAVALADRDP